MSTVAFIGLGIMGSPMAAHLARAGHDVVGHNRTPGKDGPLREAGGRGAASVAEAVAGAEVVALMVPDTPDVEAVLRGPSGVFANAPEGALVIDFSTIRPDITAALAREAADHGLGLLDAPVSGGEAGAVAATLSIMAGGSAADFERARPLLDVVGATVVHVGPSGAGQTVKAANQLMVAAHLQALAEAVTFLEAHGVDLPSALDVLAGGLAGSAVITQKREKMLTREFAPGFRVDLHHKDLGIVEAAAREAGLALPVAGVMTQLMASARACGDGGLDHSALLRGVARLSGLAPDGPAKGA